MSDVKLPTKITGDRWNDVQGRTEAGSGCWDQPIGKFCGTIKCAAVRPLTSKYRAMGEITIQNSWTGNQYMLSRKWLTSVRIPLFTTVAVATSPMQLNNHTQRDAFRHIWTVRYRTPYEQQTLKRDCDDTFFDVNWQKKKKKKTAFEDRNTRLVDYCGENTSITDRFLCVVDHPCYCSFR